MLAFLIRIFSVIRYESVIHEFDPWFNYRTTQYLTNEGVYEFWNWFDPESWYPLGRVIGGTIYPGLMLTSAALHWLCNFLLFPVDIRSVAGSYDNEAVAIFALVTTFYLFIKAIDTVLLI